MKTKEPYSVFSERSNWKLDYEPFFNYMQLNIIIKKYLTMKYVHELIDLSISRAIPHALVLLYKNSPMT